MIRLELEHFGNLNTRAPENNREAWGSTSGVEVYNELIVRQTQLLERLKLPQGRPNNLQQDWDVGEIDAAGFKEHDP